MKKKSEEKTDILHAVETMNFKFLVHSTIFDTILDIEHKKLSKPWGICIYTCDTNEK